MSSKSDSLELTFELAELRDLGLTEEEIEGYLEFFADRYDLTSVDVH